jgi:hypothetical protein
MRDSRQELTFFKKAQRYFAVLVAASIFLMALDYALIPGIRLLVCPVWVIWAVAWYRVLFKEMYGRS